MTLGVADPAQPARTDEGAADAAADIAALSARGSASMDECLAAITDLEQDGSEPLLRRVVHRILERSVAEFFTDETATSVQLPPELVRWTLPDPDAISLPEAGPPPEWSLADALDRRRSQRNYANRELTAQELGDVLCLAAGRNGTEDGYGTRGMPLFPYPSIGGLDPTEVGVVLQRVADFPGGYYRYDKVGHGLVPLLTGDLRMPLVEATFESDWLFYAPAIVILSNDQMKVSWKYRTRGYRISGFDLGAVLQNLYLACTAYDLNCCAVAGYDDGKVNELLGHTGADQPVGDKAVGVLAAIGPGLEHGTLGSRR